MTRGSFLHIEFIYKPENNFIIRHKTFYCYCMKTTHFVTSFSLFIFCVITVFILLFANLLFARLKGISATNFTAEINPFDCRCYTLYTVSLPSVVLTVAKDHYLFKASPNTFSPYIVLSSVWQFAVI